MLFMCERIPKNYISKADFGRAEVGGGRGASSVDRLPSNLTHVHWRDFTENFYKPTLQSPAPRPAGCLHLLPARFTVTNIWHKQTQEPNDKLNECVLQTGPC